MYIIIKVNAKAVFILPRLLVSLNRESLIGSSGIQHISTLSHYSASSLATEIHGGPRGGAVHLGVGRSPGGSAGGDGGNGVWEVPRFLCYHVRGYPMMTLHSIAGPRTCSMSPRACPRSGGCAPRAGTRPHPRAVWGCGWVGARGARDAVNPSPREARGRAGQGRS